MVNISKKLKNLFKIYEGAKLNEFISDLKKEFDTVSISLPKYRINYIDSKFIDKTWNEDVNLEKTVLIGRKSNYIVIAFANPDFENVIIDKIKEYGLNAEYSYLLEDDDIGIIVREHYIDGMISTDEDKESGTFDITDYDVSKLFKTVRPVMI